MPAVLSSMSARPAVLGSPSGFRGGSVAAMRGTAIPVLRPGLNAPRAVRKAGTLCLSADMDFDRTNAVLGVDIGGSGVKAAPVNILTGEVLAERKRIETPQPATPEAVCATVGKLVHQFEWEGPIGCGFPAVVKHGRVGTAANIDESWIGQDLHALLREYTGLSDVAALNDADAAGAAEMRFGAGRGKKGLVLMVTIGTGLGTALFTDGHLVPNTELGHIYLPNGKEGEAFAANSVRERENMEWKKWGKRLNKYLREMDSLFWPDLIILGGGVSKKADRFMPYLVGPKAEIVPAEMLNFAGIVGAAVGGWPDLVDQAVIEAGGLDVVLGMIAEREASEAAFIQSTRAGGSAGPSQ